MWDLPTRSTASAATPSASTGDEPSSPPPPDRESSNVVGDSAYRRAIDALLASYRAIPPTATVRLAKRTSNLFRARRPTNTPGLDVTGLQGVLSIDSRALTADVGGMCTYETLVAATLPHGLAPLVVPQLKTITVGGAATGGGIESSSFRNGLVFDDIVELDILTGAGEVVTAAPHGPHADLFHSFANSYGTLGYATRLRVTLEPVTPFVALRHLRFTELRELESTMDTIIGTGRFDGATVDYLDGVVFSGAESYLTLGTRTDEPGPTSDYTGRQIYYRSIQQRTTDRLTIHDYLWRWDTDWFWCSRAFGAQSPLIRRLWPKRLLRSSVYWKMVALDRRFAIADRVERLHGRPPLERVVQDIEVPIDRTADFLTWFLRNVPIEPIWLCPLRLPPNSAAAGQPRWPLYPIPPEQSYVNIGFWSVVPSTVGDDGATNRRIERQVNDLGGHKSLYSDAYYSPAEFAALYGGATYAAVKAKYDPQSRLLTLYDKAVHRR